MCHEAVCLHTALPAGLDSETSAIISWEAVINCLLLSQGLRVSEAVNVQRSGVFCLNGCKFIANAKTSWLA